ncbi:unnamed protein product [Ceutorhynchus assimilis]|uniref:CCHC-type domain-containing protein n=1 Tax=Ceutorhynchus assimilis TaxID=467358 RepID=A0A9P0DVH6_9CUCU|nr:unnamed protein product [Ceutorhynchus assimilis]
MRSESDSDDNELDHRSSRRKHRHSKSHLERNLARDRERSRSESPSNDDENRAGRRKEAKKRRIEELIATKVTEILSQIQPTINDPSSASSTQQSTSRSSSGINFAKSEIVPIFDPEIGDVNSQNWLNKIEQLGMIHHWDDATKSYFMQSKLSGIAKLWYNGLREYSKSWVDWKNALLKAFPSHENFVDNLKLMLDRKKQPDETILHYYYSKCVLIRKCDISDVNATSCIIDGLPHEHQATAKSAYIKTPEELFQGFLCKLANTPVLQKSEKNMKTDLAKCHVCKKGGHLARNCFFRDASAGPSGQSKFSEFKKPGDFKSGGAKRIKECSHCNRKGHVKEDCWHLNPAKVQLLQRQVPNSSYMIDVSINNNTFKGYLDTGSQINVANITVMDKLNIKLEPSNIVVKGFDHGAENHPIRRRGRLTNQDGRV